MVEERRGWKGNGLLFAGSFWLCSDHIGLSVEFLPAKPTNILEDCILGFCSWDSRPRFCNLVANSLSNSPIE